MGKVDKTKPAKPPTVKDIERESGVAYRTVLEIMSGRASGEKYYYSQEAKAKVLATAEKLGYRPNRSARNTVNKRHGVISLVMSNVFQVNQVILNALAVVAARHNHLLVIDLFHEKDDIMPRCLREDMSDGIIITSVIPPVLERQLDDLGTPIIDLNTNRHHANNCISWDQHSAATCITDNMISSNRTHLCHIGHRGQHRALESRKTNLRHVCKDRALAAPICTELNTHTGVTQGCIELINAYPQCDAFFVPETYLLNFSEACATTGKEIGTDLSIMSERENRYIAKNMTPPIPLLDLNTFDIGRLAVENLLAAIDGETVTSQEISYVWRNES